MLGWYVHCVLGTMLVVMVRSRVVLKRGAVRVALNNAETRCGVVREVLKRGAVRVGRAMLKAVRCGWLRAMLKHGAAWFE